MSNHFTNIVVCDFEYEVADGDLPKVLCLVAHVLDSKLRHKRTIRKWRGEFGPMPPFDIGPNTLVVGYSLWAEMMCFMTLGWPFPVHLFDQHTAYLAATNVLYPYMPDETRKKPRKRLSDACRAYGVEGWENIDKEAISKTIGNGTWCEHYTPQQVFDYCEEDVLKSVELFRKQITGHSRFAPADVDRTLFWSEYSAKAVAQIQAKGMPIDMYHWNLVQENKDAVIKHLLKTFDPSHGTENPIYTPDGHWSDHRFEAWLLIVGIMAWPRLDSGKLQIDGTALKLMYGAHPGIEGLHALKDSLGVIVRAKLPIGPDGRNRPSIFPFGTVSGRNAHAKSLFNAHAGMRSFMLFPPNKVVAYLDWKAQEVAVAAANSGDLQLMHDYSGDIYHALAVMCGLTDDLDIAHWKKTQKPMRDRMKPLQLGINYGMGVPSFAKGLDRHPLIASEIIERHKRRYPPYWAEKEKRADAAMVERKMLSPSGWPMYLSNSPNRRTLYNFPMQSGGAEMLRLAAVRLCEAGLVPNMLVHDAILLEADTEEQIAQAAEIMKQAGRDVLGGFEVGVDIEWMKDGRFRDKRLVAKRMWETIMKALQAVGALPKGPLP